MNAILTHLKMNRLGLITAALLALLAIATTADAHISVWVPVLNQCVTVSEPVVHYHGC
jgi:hypothetical protein